jgi:hypothetical protein
MQAVRGLEGEELDDGGGPPLPPGGGGDGVSVYGDGESAEEVDLEARGSGHRRLPVVQAAARWPDRVLMAKDPPPA